MKGGQEKTPEVIPTSAGGKGFVDQEKRCTYSQPDKQEFETAKRYRIIVKDQRYLL